MSFIERLLAAAIVFVVFVYVVLRAIYVPTFHDEAATIFHYIVSENFWPYKAHWDANNHILNSALAYCGYKGLGMELIWLRLPNVLSFLIYSFFAYRLANSLKNNVVRWVALLALLTAAFPLEFFAQARGYGMSLAFLLAAIYYLQQFLIQQKTKYQILLWFWMCCAVAANMALINMYAIIIGLVGLQLLALQYQRIRNMLVLVVFGLVPLALAVAYALELKARGLLYTGFPDGFVKITVGSLIRHQFGVESPIVAWVVAMLALAAALFIIKRFVWSGFFWTMGRLLAVLLLLNALASIALNLLLGVNFPEDRVGVYFFPLFILTCLAAINQLATSKPKWHWLALGFLVFPVHLLSIINLNTTLLWPPWHVSESTYNFAYDRQKQVGTRLMISSHYLNELGWAFWNFKNDAIMQPLQRKPVPDTLADLLIARTYDFDFNAVPYKVVFEDKPNGVHVLERTKPVPWSGPRVLKPLRNTIHGNDEFYELFNDSVRVLPGKLGYLDFTATVAVTNGLWEGHFIIASYNASGQSSYDYVPMHWLRPRWDRAELHIKRTYQFADDAHTFKIYFWNIHQNELDIQLSDFSFYTVQQEG